MESKGPESVRGRGTAENPADRFTELLIERDPDLPPEAPPTTVYSDASRTILSRNDSPDIPFEWSANPYRGCEHGCVYCYARPTHEYLGLSAGLDFETKLFAKPDAPKLLHEALAKPSWKPQVVAFSGVTDCYQPLEASYELTRRCLEVCLRHRQPFDEAKAFPVPLNAAAPRTTRLEIPARLGNWPCSRPRG